MQARASIRRATAVVASCACACSSTGTDGGDYTLPGVPDVRGDGARLSVLNDPANPRPSSTEPVLVTGAVVGALDDFDETHDGASAGDAYAQDLDPAAPPYSGITLFAWSGSPPAWRPAPGDVVDVRGLYQEFAGPSGANAFDAGKTLPEISGAAVSLRLEYQTPKPKKLPLSELASYASGRKWIGMLVRVENVRLHADGFASASGRYSARLWVDNTDLAELPTITNALFDLEASGIELGGGTEFKAIVGIAQYFYNFSIAPRSAADLER